MNAGLSPVVRVAIAQPAMQWSGDANTQALADALAFAAAHRVDVCVFPELAVTGFHRRIAELATPAQVESWLRIVRSACAATGVAASFGAPTFASDGRIRNSQLFVDGEGHDLSSVDKRGLTAPEATFFAAGAARPVVEWRGLRCTAVICREVEDHDAVCDDLRETPADLIFWPGLMGPEAGSEHLDPPRHVAQAQRLATSLRAHVVQANWPNSLNYPEESAKTGHSAVIDGDGRLAFRLPRAEPGIGIFTLGGATFAWHPAAP